MSFGRVYQYLLSQGRITPRQLKTIMEEQHGGEHHPADCAMRLGHITPQEARRIRVAQVKMNLPFLRAALDLGVMTHEQVEQVRESLSNESGLLGQRLEALGLLSSGEFAAAMRGFMDEQVRFAENVMVLPADVPERGAMLRMFEITGEMFVRYWEMDVTGLDFETRSVLLPLAHHNAEVRLHGALSMRYYLGVNRECANAAALELLGETIESDEERDDLVRELANVSCGHGLGALAISGKRVEMHPPTSVRTPVALGQNKAVMLTLMTPFGPAKIAMAYPLPG